MENTQKKLSALNADSVRNLVKVINELQIQKEDVLKIFYLNDSYYLLYYTNCNQIEQHDGKHTES